MYAHVSVRILEKEYQVACPASERSDLLDSAEILNAKMREIRDSGKVVGLDRVSVMAALNITHDYLECRREDQDADNRFSPRITALREKLDAALEEYN